MKEIKFNCKNLGIQCQLHNICNLQCKFCFQSNNEDRQLSMININYIKNLPNNIIGSLNPIIKDNDIQKMSIFLMGGELFSDNISDEVFGYYEEFIITLRNLFHDIDCQFSIISNGVFAKYDRVGKLLRSFNIRLILSYDSCDRFSNDHQKQMWLDTFEYFRNKGINLGLSTVLTKRNINAYIAGDEIFNSIQPDVYIDSNIYIPRLDYYDYLPSDDDIYNFYKWCLDHEKFNISDINNIIRYSTICNQEYYFMFRENFPVHQSDCLEGLPFSKKEYYNCHIKDDHDCINSKRKLGIEKRGCMTCEYYMNCSEMCWSQILFKDYQITECPIKRIYSCIENTPSIMDRYKQWEDKYGERYKKY